MTRSTIKLLFFVSGALLLSCEQDKFDPKQQPFPLIRTLPVSDNDATGVQFHAEVIKAGSSPVIDHGFVWTRDKRPLPGPDTVMISLGNDLKNDFSVHVTNKIIAGVKYQIMAYATVAGTTVYGDKESFTSKRTGPTRITSFSPAGVLDYDQLTIHGELFNELDNEVTIDGHAAKVIAFNAKSVTVTVPPINHAGPVHVVVEAFFAKATSDELIVINPTVTSISPASGAVGQTITLLGRFSTSQATNQVSVGGFNAYLANSTKDKIIASVPAAGAGPKDVTVTVNGKSTTVSNGFLIQ